jgi:hypothetical protein
MVKALHSLGLGDLPLVEVDIIIDSIDVDGDGGI